LQCGMTDVLQPTCNGRDPSRYITYIHDHRVTNYLPPVTIVTFQRHRRCRHSLGRPWRRDKLHTHSDICKSDHGRDQSHTPRTVYYHHHHHHRMTWVCLSLAGICLVFVLNSLESDTCSTPKSRPNQKEVKSHSQQFSDRFKSCDWFGEKNVSPQNL
jgi:hypothetical protein